MGRKLIDNIVAKTDRDNPDRPFNYMLLDRLRMDCYYFLGNGGRCEKLLWAHSVDKQIAKMKELWHGFIEKPHWISLEEIEKLEQQMKQL